MAKMNEENILKGIRLFTDTNCNHNMMNSGQIYKGTKDKFS